MKLEKIKITVMSLCLLVFCTEGICGKIVYPWRATTAIVKAGDSFTVWFDADKGQTVSSVRLQGEFLSVSMPSITRKTGTWVYDKISGNKYNNQVTVAVPADAPADRYDLVLETTKGKEISKRSVKVVKDYKSEYTIMHISDTHFCQGEREKGFIERLKKITEFVNFANIIDAEIVFLTGDLINNNMFPAAKRANYFYNGYEQEGLDGVYGFDAATFSTIGNHDFLENEMPQDSHYQEKAQYWNECHGLQYHHFKYGDSRCMILNVGWNGFDWSYQLEDHISWLDEVGPGKFRCAAYHKSEMGIMGEWGNKVNLDLSMIGHNHHLAHKNPYELGGRPIQYYANSVREYVNMNLYRVKADGSYSVVNNLPIVENYKEEPSKWKPKLRLDFAKENDGSVDSNIAILENKFDVGFPRALVRFVMPKGGKYSVSGGKVEQAFDGDKVRVVDVRFAVDPQSKKKIEIKKSSK